MAKKAKIFYVSLLDELRREDKLAWFRENPFWSIEFEHITPDEQHNWIVSENDFADFLPLMDRGIKFGYGGEAVFRLYSLGVSTNRDVWITDYSPDVLLKKMQFFIDEYNRVTTPKESASCTVSVKTMEIINQMPVED